MIRAGDDAKATRMRCDEESGANDPRRADAERSNEEERRP